MIKNSRTLTHVGVNFIIAPGMPFTKADSLRFQSQLETRGIETSNVMYGSNQISIVRQSQKSAREIRLQNPGPQVAQFSILMPMPEYSLEAVEDEIDTISELYNNVWPSKGKQILVCDASIHSTYETDKNSAFEEIWEHKLVQPSSILSVFDRPVKDGGLRFVMPPQNPLDAVVELRIESLLTDPKKIFVNLQFIWKNPTIAGDSLDSSKRIQEVERFQINNVMRFFD